MLAREISGGVGVGRKINDFIVPLYDKEYERLVAIAYRRTNDWALAQDLVQIRVTPNKELQSIDNALVMATMVDKLKFTLSFSMLLICCSIILSR